METLPEWYTDRFSNWLAQRGATNEAAQTQDVLYQTLADRRVRGRPVLDRVLQEIKACCGEYKSKK